MRIRVVPKEKLRLSPYELMYGRPFLTNDFVLDEETCVLRYYAQVPISGPGNQAVRDRHLTLTCLWNHMLHGNQQAEISTWF